MSPNSLEPSDIDTLEDLLLRSQQARAREALCIKIGIDPKRLWFIRNSSDTDFVTHLIYYLKDVDDNEALCKLCCQELLPLFNKSKYRLTLEKIAVKLNCNHDFGQNSSKNKTVEQSTSLIHKSKPESWFTKIGNVNKKLLAGGAILLIVLTISPAAYEHFNPPSQLVQDRALRDEPGLVRSESQGNIGEYIEGKVFAKPTNINLRNFIIEAEFKNPYDGARDNWTYGFSFRENTSDDLNDSNRKGFSLWVSSKNNEWNFNADNTPLSGKLSNLDISAKSSNKLSLTIQGKNARFFVNDKYIETIDIKPLTNKGDIILIIKEGISGKTVQYENLKVWSLD